MSLFEPDILNDYAARRRTGNSVPAEWRLMVAVLADAIDCFRKNLNAPGRRRRRLFLEAEEWILSDDRDWVFSFRNICDVLGFDAEALRQQTCAWKRRQLQHHAPGATASEERFGIAS